MERLGTIIDGALKTMKVNAAYVVAVLPRDGDGFLATGIYASNLPNAEAVVELLRKQADAIENRADNESELAESVNSDA